MLEIGLVSVWGMREVTYQVKQNFQCVPTLYKINKYFLIHTMILLNFMKRELCYRTLYFLRSCLLFHGLHLTCLFSNLNVLCLLFRMSYLPSFTIFVGSKEFNARKVLLLC